MDLMEPIPHSRPTLDDREIAAVTSVLTSGMLIQGERVTQFEQALAAMIGVNGAAAVSSGTAALHLALLALKVKAGDEVAMPSFVCPALLNAVRYVHARPVLADIDPVTFNVDVDDLKRRLTAKTRALIVPHMFGLPADMKEIVALGVPVIEDCAQALGSRYQGRPVGSLGMLSVFSFYATKVICTGEGGMVATQDRQLLEVFRDLRDYDEKGNDARRYNYKLTDLQAAMGLAQLEKLPGLIERRRFLARQYGSFLADHALPAPVCPQDRHHIYYRYVVRTRRLPELLAHGQAVGIAYRRPVFKPLHRYLRRPGYPVTDSAYHESVSLPLYPAIEDDQVRVILENALPFLVR